MEIIKTKIQLPTEYKELFNPKWRYLLYYGGRGSLKSHSVARALLVRGRQQKLRILCTREIQKTIDDSVLKLLKDLIIQYELDDYAVTQKTIRNTKTGTEFLFAGIRLNVTEIKSMEGIDICWVEEAQSITEESLDVLTPTIRKEGSQIIFTYNRVNELDPVHVRYVMNQPEGAYSLKVNYDVAERLGWLPDVLKLELEEDRKDPVLFAHKWLGEPIGQAEKSIVARDAILSAMDRSVEPEGKTIVGADIARMGNDRTVFWKRKGLKTISHEIHSKLRTTEVCDALERFIDFDKTVEVKVDDTGVGGGVTDEMVKRGYEVVAINFGAKPGDPDKYPNLISEAWFHMANIISDTELPMHSDLLMELSTRQWKQDTRGRRAVESKGEYKKRGFRSPDIADACIICYYEPQTYITMDDIAM